MLTEKLAKHGITIGRDKLFDLLAEVWIVGTAPQA